MQHRQRAGYVEPTYGNLDAGRPQRTSDIHGPRILIGLHPDQGDQALVTAQLAGDDIGLDASVGFIDKSDLDVNVFAQYLAGFTVQR